MARSQSHGSHGEFDRLVRSAVAHYEAHEARAAIADLERAFAIRPVPRLLYNLGRAHEQASEWVAAADYYQRFLDSRPDAEAEMVTREALGVARRHIAESQALESQRQADLARQRETELTRQRMALEAQHRADLDRQRQGQTPHPVARRVTTAVAALWTGTAVALVGGGVLGGLALRDASSFPNVRQGDARASLVDRGTALAWASNGALGAAVIAGVVGLVLYLTQPTQTAETSP